MTIFLPISVKLLQYKFFFFVSLYVAQFEEEKKNLK